MRLCPALSATAVSDGEFVSGIAKCLIRECNRHKRPLTSHLADLRSWLQFLAYRVHCSREDLVYGVALFQKLDSRAFKHITAMRLKGYSTAAMATAATVLREGIPIVANWSMLIGDQFDLRAVQDEFLKHIHWRTNVPAAEFERVSLGVAEACGLSGAASRGEDRRGGVVEEEDDADAPGCSGGTRGAKRGAGGARGAEGARGASGASRASAASGVSGASGTPSAPGSPRTPRTPRTPDAYGAHDAPGAPTYSPASRVHSGMFRSHSSSLFLLNAGAAPRFGVQTNPGLDGSFSDRESSSEWDYR